METNDKLRILRVDAVQLADAVLDAAGQFGLTISGSKLAFDLDPNLFRLITGLSFSPTAQPETRRAGLHSLAALAGVDWGQGETLRPLLLPDEVCSMTFWLRLSICTK